MAKGVRFSFDEYFGGAMEQEASAFVDIVVPLCLYLCSVLSCNG